MVYFEAQGEKIVCQLCFHACRLKEGQSGLCGVEKNEHGELVNLSFGRPTAVHIDPVEKKPLYHFYPGCKTLSIGTVGCNLRCSFCQNWQISQSHEWQRSYTLSPAAIVQEALRDGCKAIAYTYNEPTVFYPFAKAVGERAKEAGLLNIFVSNGCMSDKVAADMASWVDAANIDLKSFESHYYKKALKGSLEQVKANIIALKRLGVWVEVTTLLVPGENDSEEEIAAMARFMAEEVGRDTPWHLSAFHPDYKMLDHRPTPLASLQQAREIAERAGMAYIYLGNVAEPGVTRCPKCQEELILRRGFSVVENRLENGRCPSCNAVAAGRFV